MKSETLAIFSFSVSLIAYEFLGLLVLFAVATASFAGSGVVETGSITVAMLATIGAILTGLKVYAIESGSANLSSQYNPLMRFSTVITMYILIEWFILLSPIPYIN